MDRGSMSKVGDNQTEIRRESLGIQTIWLIRSYRRKLPTRINNLWMLMRLSMFSSRRIDTYSLSPCS